MLLFQLLELVRVVAVRSRPFFLLSAETETAAESGLIYSDEIRYATKSGARLSADTERR